MKSKKIPLRKCTGCGEMKNKKELIRIVKNKEGQISLDTTGKMAGRGAYICHSVECLEAAIKNKGLERSFKGRVTNDIYEQLKSELMNSNE